MNQASTREKNFIFSSIPKIENQKTPEVEPTPPPVTVVNTTNKPIADEDYQISSDEETRKIFMQQLEAQVSPPNSQISDETDKYAGRKISTMDFEKLSPIRKVSPDGQKPKIIKSLKRTKVDDFMAPVVKEIDQKPKYWYHGPKLPIDFSHTNNFPEQTDLKIIDVESSPIARKKELLKAPSKESITVKIDLLGPPSDKVIASPASIAIIHQNMLEIENDISSIKSQLLQEYDYERLHYILNILLKYSHTMFGEFGNNVNNMSVSFRSDTGARSHSKDIPNATIENLMGKYKVNYQKGAAI